VQLSVRPNARIPFEIRYEDPDLLVVDKPAGLVTQPGKGHAHDSLLNGLFHRFGGSLQNLGLARDWGLLHRLDRDTSGLVVVGLRPAAYDDLREQFETRKIKKRYLALVWGCPRPRQGTIQQPIAEVQDAQKRAVVRRNGKPAVTAYEVLAVSPVGGERDDAGRDATVSLVNVRPRTGRLHQIRAHMAWLGHPVAGDSMYGEGRGAVRAPRLCLHAAEVSLLHPADHRRITVESPWPEDLREFVRKLGLGRPAALRRAPAVR
jgi:23S rRNA pseudouridine1911/1915/1917 synthase